MADGRVSLSWSENNGLTGLDVFNSLLDTRDGPVTISGTVAADTFFGTDFVKLFFIDPFDNTISYVVSGDTISYAASAAGVRADLDHGELNRGDAAGDVLVSFENITGTGFADQLRGSGGDNVLLGGGGNDQLVGRGGNDFLDGGTGDDGISGGTGNDIIFGGDGIDVLYGNAGDDAMDGGIGVDFLAGGLGDDVIDGGDGNDTINGGADDDILDGGIGNDVIAGGIGFNVIDGGAGTDTLSYASIPSLSGQAGATNIYVDLDYTADAVGNMDGFQADDDLIFNIENITAENTIKS